MLTDTGAIYDSIMDVQMSDRAKVPHNSLLGMMKQFLEAVDDMNSTVMIPSRLLDMNMDDHEKTNSEDSNENRVVVKDNSNVENRDLYTYFSLLKTIKKDLIRGASVTDEDSESSEEEDAPNAKATQSAILFREHLGGLCNVLHQLTEVAQFLTTKYQQETGDFQTCPRPKPFTM